MYAVESYTMSLSCLVSFTQQTSKLILLFNHVNAFINNSSFFFPLSDIPLEIYHSLIIHSCTDGHLGCFQFVAITN